ncbi:sensor domain-containing protein [Arthrobacter rhizosphaerae]|uniref:sensor domain-containing protein n=1 Tax=Arthrobacter rhizosphaerae TaxID=2855490 RepID=UPI001FF27AE0|nr:EAL domain-containing protein [Arthrobacter rhizosphaerae]
MTEAQGDASADAGLDISPDALLILAPDGTIRRANSAAERLFGRSRDELLGSDHRILLAEGFLEAIVWEYDVLRKSPDPVLGNAPIEPVCLRGDGSEFPAEIVCSLLPAPGLPAPQAPGSQPPESQTPGPSGQAAPSLAMSVRDATYRKVGNALAEEASQLRAMAFQDQLTGLANRQLFNDQLAQAMRRPRHIAVDVILLDLDDFKEVNDIHGHHAGDQMLIETARRLRSCVRPNDTVGRLGGDEFVVLLTNVADPAAVAERIMETLNVPVNIGGAQLKPSLSLGLASMSETTMEPSDLLRQADVAMYAAKAGGKNRYMRFRPEMLRDLAHRNDMEARLRVAVLHGEVKVQYQPVVSTGSGREVQLEALARWERDGEFIPPGQFIPMAERSGLISDLGNSVMARACVELQPWLAADKSRSLTFNVSGGQLHEHDFADVALRIASSCRVDPGQLVLEVTESVFLDPGSQVIDQLKHLRRARMRVALDDFGTGYSSLGRLQDLPVDAVKIDGSFVSMVRTGAEKLPLLSSMITMAHGLNLSVTAEGIETPAQAEYLMDLGCDFLQGYLFSRPVSDNRLDMAMTRAETAMESVRGLRVGGRR